MKRGMEKKTERERAHAKAAYRTALSQLHQGDSKGLCVCFTAFDYDDEIGLRVA